MRTKQSGQRLFEPTPGPNRTIVNWSNDCEGEREFYLQARCYHMAAKTLLAKLQPGEDDKTQKAQAAPIVFIYRQALEWYLKATVLGDGSNFLPCRPDPLAVWRTHSLRRLGQLVCQLGKAVGWGKRFSCLGIKNLAQFRAVATEVDSMPPGVHPARYADVWVFSIHMDAILNLLEQASDELAEKWKHAEALAIQAESSGEK